MKTIYLMRHAKTEPGRADLADEDRGLTERGKADAACMGKWLATQTPQPEAAFLSTSRRTGQTAELVKTALGDHLSLYALEELYLAWASELADLIRSQDEMIDTLIVINHEPGLSTLTRVLASPGAGENCTRAFDHFPTGAVAVLEMPGASWADLAPQSAQFKSFVTPKDLQANS